MSYDFLSSKKANSLKVKYASDMKLIQLFHSMQHNQQFNGTIFLNAPNSNIYFSMKLKGIFHNMVLD